MQSHQNSPLVTVNILSWNRREALRKTLHELRGATYANIEMIVVDNASTDGSAQMVAEEFPAVHLVRLSRNIGIAGWNAGFAEAKGKYVLVLDDDSYPSNDVIEKMVAEFEQDTALGIAAFQIVDPETGQSENQRRVEVLEAHGLRDVLFIGCGAGIRSEVIAKVGGFSEDYFLYMHETEFATRVIAQGYSVKLFPEMIVYHAKSYSSNAIAKRTFYDTRNGLRYCFKYFPFYRAVTIGGKHLGTQLSLAIRHRVIRDWIKGIIDFARIIPRAFHERAILDRKIQDFILTVRKRFRE